MKHICSLVLVFGAMAASAPPALAADGVHASGIVETPNAVFFQPSQFPSVVWFFPRTELTLASVPPQLPTGTYWRAAVVFKAITADDLALLPPEWTGKSFVPFIIRPTTECTLTRLPEMRFVIQEVKALGRDVSAASSPVCRFSFRLPRTMSPDLQQRLTALMSSDTLIERVLNLDLQLEAAIAWADVHAAVTAALEASQVPGSPPAPALTRAEAQAVVESALASPALGPVRSTVTPLEEETFIHAALATLFTESTDPTPLLRLVASAPPGAVVYHLEPVTFSQLASSPLELATARSPGTVHR